VTPVEIAVDDSGRGVVLSDAGPVPFDVDLSTGSAALTTPVGRVLVRSMTWREKRTVARFRRLGGLWVDRTIADACASPRNTDGPSDGLLAGLARWLENGSDELDDLDADRLAAVTVALCRAIALAPNELDALPAGEVEDLWRAVHAGSSDAPITADTNPSMTFKRARAALPRNDDAWAAQATRIVVVDDPVRAAMLARPADAEIGDAEIGDAEIGDAEMGDAEIGAGRSSPAIAGAANDGSHATSALDKRDDAPTPGAAVDPEARATPRSATAAVPRRVARWPAPSPASRTIAPIRVTSDPAVLGAPMPGAPVWRTRSRSADPMPRPAVPDRAPEEDPALPAESPARASGSPAPLPEQPVALMEWDAGHASVRSAGELVRTSPGRVGRAVPRHPARRAPMPMAGTWSIATPVRAAPRPVALDELRAPMPLIAPDDAADEQRTLGHDERIQLLQHLADELERAAEDLGIGDAPR
jgi:hypothetical protein